MTSPPCSSDCKSVLSSGVLPHEGPRCNEPQWRMPNQTPPKGLRPFNIPIDRSPMSAGYFFVRLLANNFFLPQGPGEHHISLAVENFLFPQPALFSTKAPFLTEYSILRCSLRVRTVPGRSAPTGNLVGRFEFSDHRHTDSFHSVPLSPHGNPEIDLIAPLSRRVPWFSLAPPP